MRKYISEVFVDRLVIAGLVLVVLLGVLYVRATVPAVQPVRVPFPTTQSVYHNGEAEQPLR